MKATIFRLSVQGCINSRTTFYNDQFIGLAKALGLICEKVTIYKNVYMNFDGYSEKITDNVILNVVPGKTLGVHGFIDLSIVDTDTDLAIVLSDNQMDVPRLYRWANRNNILFLPYIGVLESHSESKIKRLIMDMALKRDIAVYKKCHCLAKTPDILDELHKKGISDVSLFPVGLDQDLLKLEYNGVDKNRLREKMGYTSSDKIVLLVGRLEEERDPLRMITIFKKVSDANENYRLIIVGKGKLHDKVVEAIADNNIQDKVRIIDSIPNCDMWEIYRIADYSVGLNQNEIFGMSILEAMFYGLTVVACHAPGPDFIIENEKNGFLITKDDEAVSTLLEKNIDTINAHNRIADNFMWNRIALKIMEICNNYREA